jgi:tetratricopeptide (TPR) repeat protein
MRQASALLLTGAGITASLCASNRAYAQPISDRILSDVSATSVGSCAVMTVNFNVNIQILSFFPQTGGRELHVRVKPLEGRPLTRESLRVPTDVHALRSIEYEGDNASGPVLSLFFNRDVKFDVAAGESPQTVIISITDPGNTAACRAVETSHAASPVETPQSRPASSDAPVSSGGVGLAQAPAGLYVVNILSQAGDIGDLPEAKRRELADLVVYETKFERDGQMWHRLRAGFFETRAAAQATRARLSKMFPDAWVVSVAAQEREQGVAARLDMGGIARATSSTVAASGPASPAEVAKAVKTEADAEAALKAGENDRAIQLLTQALTFAENERTPRALELLGLTRERKGQLAHARAEYEDYLRRYPSGEGSDRVRQRLSALNAPGTAAPEQLRAASGPKGQVASASNWRWGLRGSFSQFYLRDQSTTSVDAARIDPNAIDPVTGLPVRAGTPPQTLTNLNQLQSNADISVTGGNDRMQVLLRAAGAYSADFRPTGRDVKALTALYLDISDSRTNTSIRVGRQTRNNSGILGRFDGALLGWQAKPKLRFNIAGGFPVLSSRQLYIGSDRAFYGLSADIGGKRDALQTTVYWFDQRSHGLVDRQAIGTEIRYIKGSFNAYAILDYDVKFNKLNLGLLTFNYTMKDQSSISVTADYRQSPLLTTANALQGQTFPGGLLPILNLGDLKPFFTDQQIYRIAQDNTLVAKSLTVSYSRPLTAKLQTNLDFTLTNTGGTAGTFLVTPGSLPIDPQPATGREYYYGAQLIGNGMIFSNDIYILSGRYADTQRSRTYTADINARIPITSKLRISPRARYGIREDKFSDGRFQQFQPTLRVNYYPIRQAEIEIEVGGNFSHQRSTLQGNSSETGIFLSAGYRLDF